MFLHICFSFHLIKTGSFRSHLLLRQSAAIIREFFSESGKRTELFEISLMHVTGDSQHADTASPSGCPFFSLACPAAFPRTLWRLE